MLPQLIVTLLLVCCFGLAAYFEPVYTTWKGDRRNNAIAMLIGDSRKLFANHFYAKADAYFHGGYYPSIFDLARPEKKSHMETHSEHHESGEHDDSEFLEEPKDWIEAFGRNFFPSHHTHLENAGDFRELLPWLRLTAELDPQKVETYTVAAFALRTRLNKVKEAEQFLRDGMRANPDSFEILLGLGRLYYEDRHDPQTARNLLELALKKWHKREDKDPDPDIFSCAQILGQLAKLEEEQGNWAKAIVYLKDLREISPSKEQLTLRIREAEAQLSASPHAP